MFKNKKLSKKYKEMIREHKKELDNLNKVAQPWDYGFGLDYFIEFMRFMKDYYELGENVYQAAPEKALETLKEALDEYELFDTAFCSGIAHDKILDYEQEHWNKFCDIIKENMRIWWD